MKFRETFILTLSFDPERDLEPTARLRHIASNREFTGLALADLAAMLAAFLEETFGFPSKRRDAETPRE